MTFASVSGSRRAVLCPARRNSFGRRLTGIAACLVMLLGIAERPLHGQSQETKTTDESANPQSSRYAQWVEQLGSDQYVRREQATRQLFEAGPDAVPLLEAAIRGGDLETSERALQVLQVIAMRQDPGQPPVAWDALTRLSDIGSGSAATRARDLMTLVAQRRIERAREALSESGIKVELNGFVLQANATGAEVVHITDDWNGDRDALAWLPWLYGIEFALLEGSSIDGKVIEQIAAMPDLRNIVFSNTAIDAEVFDRLAKMPRIDTLELRYVPIGDQATPKIAALPLRSSLSLIGTKISNDGVEALRETLPGLKIDFKRGGFLGVECHPWSVRCEISAVIPGGAAERAGLRARDVITKVDETVIERFVDLQSAIGMHAPDDPVTIVYERLGQVQTTELTLGQLPGAPE